MVKTGATFKAKFNPKLMKKCKRQDTNKFLVVNASRLEVRLWKLMLINFIKQR